MVQKPHCDYNGIWYAAPNLAVHLAVQEVARTCKWSKDPRSRRSPKARRSSIVDIRALKGLLYSDFEPNILFGL